MRAHPNAPGRTTARPLSLAEAAEATGLNKSTILRAIKSGRITGARGPTGQWDVEAAELRRVYPPKRSAEGRTGALGRGAAAQGGGREQAQRLALAAPPARRSWWQRLKGG